MSYFLLEDGSKLKLENNTDFLILEFAFVPPYTGPHYERLLEDGTTRLLEDNTTDRALELHAPVPVPPAGLIYGGYQNELPYLRCNVCNRKSYQIEYAGVTCNAWNSAPSKYPLQYCPGVLVPSILAVIPLLENQVFFQERASQ